MGCERFSRPLFTAHGLKIIVACAIVSITSKSVHSLVVRKMRRIFPIKFLLILLLFTPSMAFAGPYVNSETSEELYFSDPLEKVMNLSVKVKPVIKARRVSGGSGVLIAREYDEVTNMGVEWRVLYKKNMIEQASGRRLEADEPGILFMMNTVW